MKCTVDTCVHSIQRILRTIFSQCNDAHEYSENISTTKCLRLGYSVHLRGKDSEEDYSYPYSYPLTEMEKNPAYVPMGTEKRSPHGDESITEENPYYSPADMKRLRDIAASSASDEHTRESASYLSYI